MAQKMRRITISHSYAKSAPSWSEATLTFREHRGNDTHEAVVHVSNPGELQAVRKACDEIEKCWREQLGPAR